MKQEPTVKGKAAALPQRGDDGKVNSIHLLSCAHLAISPLQF